MLAAIFLSKSCDGRDLITWFESVHFAVRVCSEIGIVRVFDSCGICGLGVGLW